MFLLLSTLYLERRQEPKAIFTMSDSDSPTEVNIEIFGLQLAGATADKICCLFLLEYLE